MSHSGQNVEERVRIQEEMRFFQVVCTYVRMRNHTVMLVKIKGGKKGKIHRGLRNTKMPQVSGGISEIPMSGGCGIVWRGILALRVVLFPPRLLLPTLRGSSSGRVGF